MYVENKMALSNTTKIYAAADLQERQYQLVASNNAFAEDAARDLAHTFMKQQQKVQEHHIKQLDAYVKNLRRHTSEMREERMAAQVRVQLLKQEYALAITDAQSSRTPSSCQKLMCSAGITDRTSWKSWMRLNHPDKVGGGAETQHAAAAVNACVDAQAYCLQ